MATHVPGTSIVPHNLSPTTSDGTSSKGSPHTTDSDEDLEPLTGKPYFHTFVTRSALAPHYNMVIPVEGHTILPLKRIPTKLQFRSKTWEVSYNGGGVQKRFDTVGWTKFAIDNRLHVDDGLFFEVLHQTASLLTLKVRLLHGNYPPELAATLPGSEDNPVVLD